MSNAPSAGQRIRDEVSVWPGVETGPGDRGEIAFKVGRHEIGHLHGDRMAHFGFPREVWSKLIAAGRIVPHPVFPHSAGLAARPIENVSDVRDVIALMRLNYDRVVARHGLPATTPARAVADGVRTVGATG